MIHQAIDGELVIIHLDRGVYFSLGSSGALIWSHLVAGEAPRAAARAVARELGADEAEVIAAVDELVEKLRAEELLLPVETAHHDEPAPGDEPSPAAPADQPSQTGTFERPVLQRYDDLQDLLLLDPIHAVDESGWPERPDHG